MPVPLVKSHGAEQTAAVDGLWSIAMKQNSGGYGCRPEERQRLEALRDAQAGVTAAAAAPTPAKGKPAKPDPKVSCGTLSTCIHTDIHTLTCTHAPTPVFNAPCMIICCAGSLLLQYADIHDRDPC